MACEALWFKKKQERVKGLGEQRQHLWTRSGPLVLSVKPHVKGTKLQTPRGHRVLLSFRWLSSRAPFTEVVHVSDDPVYLGNWRREKGLEHFSGEQTPGTKHRLLPVPQVRSEREARGRGPTRTWREPQWGQVGTGGDGRTRDRGCVGVASRGLSLGPREPDWCV